MTDNDALAELHKRYLSVKGNLMVIPADLFDAVVMALREQQRPVHWIPLTDRSFMYMQKTVTSE